MTVDLGAGNVELDLEGAATMALGTGSIFLRYAKAPAGRVKSATGVGSIQVGLPAGTPVRFSGKAKASSLPVDPAAPTLLDLAVGIGSVEVVAI